MLVAMALMSVAFTLKGQLAAELNHPDQAYQAQNWTASWICTSRAPLADYSVTNYRKTFQIIAVPDSFIIHVSADNRYKLYVNGTLCSIGPQLSDWRHWRYETIDISPYLQAGNNVLAAEVANWGVDRFYGIMSLRTGFILQGYSDKEKIVNTDTNWKARQNQAMLPNHISWIFGEDKDIVGGFYASNPGDSILVNAYPVGWQNIEYDDSHWEPAKWIFKASKEGQTGHHWLMKARTTPQVQQIKQRLPVVARVSGIQIPPEFLEGTQKLTVPPHTNATILLDNNTVTLGFPELKIRGGEQSKIVVRYAENLLLPDLTKGDRNEIDGKAIRGVHDIIMPDGRPFVYAPLWYRAFRFVQIEVETAEEALVLEDFYNMETIAPISRRAIFDCDDNDYLQIDEICWRTAKICTQDNLMSDAYYEQMMYVGDSKVHALVNLYMSGDTTWLRNAIEQFGYSQMPHGQITSCYPVRGTFLHPNFTLIWIDMIHDYMMYCRDKQFVASYKNAIYLGLDWFDQNRLENGLIGKPVGAYFVDWYHNAPWAGKGVQPGAKDGNSATISLQYATTLIKAAEIMEHIGENQLATNYLQRAEKMKSDVFAACWDADKKLFTDNPGGDFYDERTNVLAVTSGMFDHQFQKDLLLRSFADTSVNKAGYFFRLYHFEALRKLNLGHQVDEVLDIWKALLPLHYTTTPERIARQRSDAHPWSAYPSVAFVNVVAGIAPAAPGYKSVEIRPNLGKLRYVKASYPHFLGDIAVDFKKDEKGNLSGTVKLPGGLDGTITVGDQSKKLKSGLNEVSF